MYSYPDAKGRLHQVLIPKDGWLVDQHLGQDISEKSIEIFHHPVRPWVVRRRNSVLRIKKRRICFHDVSCKMSSIVREEFLGWPVNHRNFVVYDGSDCFRSCIG